VHYLSIFVFLLWVLSFFRTLLNLALVPRLRRAQPESEPLVSIVIPARDEVRVIRATVEALLASTYRNLEVIVVDDRSADGTGDAVRAVADPRLTVVAGEELPPGWLGKPWALFRTQKWNGADRRREPRVEIVETVLIEYLDESQAVVGREVTVTENISASGARVRVKSAPAVFDMVKVTSANRAFEGLAIVRNHYSASDGCERLCLQFKDSKWLMEERAL